jgi:hypothetical protein
MCPRGILIHGLTDEYMGHLAIAALALAPDPLVSLVNRRIYGPCGHSLSTTSSLRYIRR